ncbi:MAG: hypothetical protein DHS20C07_22730 [Methyloligella sp.]|nr:MAG: hypothetical protein DHS20C07_22730 [Methyloligella sp.]
MNHSPVKKPLIEDAVAIIPVSDMAQTLVFYEQTLGFEKRFVSDDASFAMMLHGEAALHFIKAADDEALKATRTNISIYLWSKHLDELYASLEAKLSVLPEGRVRAPFDQTYAMREFHVKDPDGCLLIFGETIE